MSTTRPEREQLYSVAENNNRASSDSDSASDVENIQASKDPYNSSVVVDHDRELLLEEEERNTLLAANRPGNGLKSILSGVGSGRSKVRIGGGERRKKNRQQQKSSRGRRLGNKNEEGELLYEMEEGGGREDTSSVASSSSAELDRPKVDHNEISKRRKILRFIIISTTIAILFCLLILGAYKGSHGLSDKSPVSLLSNGSSAFAPTTILISLDGFRADFLNRGLTPTLNAFIAQGISPKYMLPSFPSLTFPNHYTLVTGLYPESHGIVGNTFWDPEFQEEFYYTDPARSMQQKWWLGGEPLWVNAEQQNVRTAIHMWPGSEAHITLEPTYVDKYNGTETLSRKVDRILEFVDTPSVEQGSAVSHRPQFIAAYVPVVDADGHLYGPNSTEIRTSIAAVDSMLHDLFVGLDERNLTEIVNIVVVSDHGMATTSMDRLIQLEDLIDVNLIDHIDGWPLYGLRPKDPSDIRVLYNQLLAESVKNTNFEVYLRDEGMPERYHFTNNDRIAPLWVIPKTGWAIVHKADFNVKEAKADGQTYHPKGLHGYDHEHPLMRAIFVARGPAFPHEPNSKLEVFQNTEVYNIVCDSLSIQPKPNNGTMRLPLKPVGLHSDDPDSAEDHPTDLPSDAEASAMTNPSKDTNGLDNALTIQRPKNGNDTTEGNDVDNKRPSPLLAWFFAKVEAIKAWANEVTNKEKEATNQSHES